MKLSNIILKEFPLPEDAEPLDSQRYIERFLERNPALLDTLHACVNQGAYPAYQEFAKEVVYRHTDPNIIEGVLFQVSRRLDFVYDHANPFLAMKLHGLSNENSSKVFYVARKNIPGISIPLIMDVMGIIMDSATLKNKAAWGPGDARFNADEQYAIQAFVKTGADDQDYETMLTLCFESHRGYNPAVLHMQCLVNNAKEGSRPPRDGDGWERWSCVMVNAVKLESSTSYRTMFRENAQKVVKHFLSPNYWHMAWYKEGPRDALLSKLTDHMRESLPMRVRQELDANMLFSKLSLTPDHWTNTTQWGIIFATVLEILHQASKRGEISVEEWTYVATWQRARVQKLIPLSSIQLRKALRALKEINDFKSQTLSDAQFIRLKEHQLC